MRLGTRQAQFLSAIPFSTQGGGMRIFEFDGTAVLRIVLIVFFAVFPKIGWAQKHIHVPRFSGVGERAVRRRLVLPFDANRFATRGISPLPDVFS